MDEHFGTLLSADSDFFPQTWPTTLQATQSTFRTPTQVANTLYPIINDPSQPTPNLPQSLLPHLTTHDKTIFPRLTISFLQITLLDKLAQMIPQTRLLSHQPQVSTFKPPNPP